MYTCQCEVLQMGQSSGVLLKEVAAIQRCPLTEISLYCVIGTPFKGYSHQMYPLLSRLLSLPSLCCI